MTSWRTCASISAINSSGSALPLAISVRRFSHSAVRAGEVRLSGRITARLMPSLVGTSCLPLRCAKPICTSFSKIAARVAGVPSPLRSASSGISSAPARSIADRSVSSESFCQGGAWIFFILLTQILSLLLPE